MSGYDPLRVHVKVGEIIVTLPFSDYTVTYYKPPNSTGLLAKNFSKEDDGPPLLRRSSSLKLGGSPTTRRAS
jgi:hypothetical protein